MLILRSFTARTAREARLANDPDLRAAAERARAQFLAANRKLREAAEVFVEAYRKLPVEPAKSDRSRSSSRVFVRRPRAAGRRRREVATRTHGANAPPSDDPDEDPAHSVPAELLAEVLR